MKLKLLRISMLSMLAMLFAGGAYALIAPAIGNSETTGTGTAEFADFEAIVNNQDGTLLTAEEQVQGTAVNFGIAVNDGVVSRVAADDASSIATISGKYHSEHGLTGMKVVVPVSGAVTILVGQCTYSGNDIKVTNAAGEEVATATPAKACWKNDRTNVTEVTYKGEATTLTITGMSYCPYIAVKKYVAPAEFADFEAIVNNQSGTLLTAEEQVQGTAVNFGIAVNNGVVSRVAADDASSIATISGKFHSEHGLTGMKVVVRVPGKVTIKVGQCTYSTSDIKVTNTAGEEVATVTPGAACWKNDNANVTELKYNGDATKLTITGMSYCPYIAVAAAKTTWDAESATATFPFNLGTEDQKADFGNQADAFLSSKVLHGATLSIKRTQTHGDITETTFLSAISNEAEPNADNAIKFIIRPYPGLVFTPTKVSFNASRYGTDSGSLDIAWLNPDGTTVSLATAQKMNRNNEAAPSAFSYDITGATPAEGECGLLLNLYNVFENKEMGFANIVIEGTLKGTKQDIPVLATITANGITYDVEKTFEVQGDNYVADIELFSTDKMISQENPVTAEVKEGTLGTITYEGNDEKTVVTIPVTLNDITMNWVANFVRKPSYTLTFYDADGTTELGTQIVEKDVAIDAFAVGADKVTVSDGYKFRGWTTQPAGLNTVKTKEGSTFQADTKLYPYISAIEVATTTARFDYDLRNQNFDFDDHEMVSIEGNGFWHDKQHGWAFYAGDKINIEMGGKGYITLSLCQYSGEGDLTLKASDGTVIGTVANKAEADGAAATIQYDGSKGAGIFTLEFPAVSYVHSISIRNQEEVPYIHTDGSNIYVVKQGNTDVENGSNLLSMLELVNGIQGTDRIVVFMPDGTYDLGETVLTSISRNNVSLIGQSMENTIIKNAPDISIEGIGTTATLLNTSSNLYMQDLTLQNALDYYGAVKAGMGGGRAVCLQDKGKFTVCKNVRMLSYQDTYYSNSNSQFYWEDSEIHGTVDYLCGGGDVYYNKVTFVNESRKADEKNGQDVIAAPYTDASSKFGYVMNNCIIENKAASFTLGRSWGGTARLTYLNTTINQPSEIASTRFTLAGMNVAAQNFHEYNSMDQSGNVVSPASLVETFSKGDVSYTYDIILSADQAADYAYDKVFTTWDPATQTVQAEAPADAKYDNGSVTWSAQDGVTTYALFKDNKFVAIVEGTTYTIDATNKEILSVRAANGMGGFGKAINISTATGINTLTGNQSDANVIYNLQGVRVSKATKGLYIINGRKVVIK